jgi:phosphoribosylamine---glycine ligase
MNILLLGSGGREHAIAWKLAQSPLCTGLFIAPGNAGTALCGTNVSLSPLDFPALRSFVLSEDISLVVVGPEEPLVRGIWDFFHQDPALSHVRLIGPSSEGARLEGSKAYAKIFMQENNIPTAAYREFSAEERAAGIEYLRNHALPIVLKADGLAAGKGVIIAQSHAEAIAEFEAMLSGKFGSAGETIVVEEFLQGIEFSVFVLTDGHDFLLLPEAKDYKRIGEKDTGLNTGGMGAVSPVPFADDALMAKVLDRIIRPTITGIQKRNITYQGFIFFGLIVVNGEPFVIEYNCRLGDPETEVVIPRIQDDLLSLLLSVHDGTLSTQRITPDTRTAATVMLVSGGYPEDYQKGKVIRGLDAIADSLIFHAGVKRHGDELLTDGGRVLAITSFADSIPQATAISNRHAELIHFDGKYFRRDIGLDLY